MATFRTTELLKRERLLAAGRQYVLRGCGASADGATGVSGQLCSVATNTTTRQDAEQRYRHQDSFDFIAASVRKCLTHLGPWSIGDLAFGIKALADTHKDLAEDIKGTPVTDGDLLQSLREEVKIADAIYEPTVQRVSQLCSLRPEDVVTFVAEGDRMRPAYCIARRPQHHQILLVIRGTKSLGDAVTILTGSAASFQGGHTHAGMLHSAHWLLHNETSRLESLLQDNPGYGLHFIGHSLGAGAAALYAMLLRERAGGGHRDLPQGILPTCTAIATPACATEDLATGCSNYVTSLVCQNDIVPRACLWGFEQLRLEVVRSDWQSDYKEKYIGEGVLDFASSTSKSVAEQYKAVAELLTGKDERTAKAVSILGEAWESVAKNASKHSDSARELLSKTSLRVSLLPAYNSDQRRKIAAKQAGSKLILAALKDLKDRVGTSHLQSLWQRLASAYSVWRRWAAQGSGMQHGSEAKAARPELSLAADDWWESSTVISGRHDIEPPWDSTLKELEGEAKVRRKALLKKMGKDVDEIAHSYGIGPPRPEGGEEKQAVADGRGLGLASDGDVDAELNKLLLDYREAQDAAKGDFTPAPRMYAPGRLIYLKRVSGDSERGHYEALRGCSGQAVGRIILSKSMITDHFCSTYMAALADVVGRLQVAGEREVGNGCIAHCFEAGH